MPKSTSGRSPSKHQRRKQPHPFSGLSFTSESRPDGEDGRFFWNVSSTGDWTWGDEHLGRQIAREAIAHGVSLNWIARDMQRPGGSSEHVQIAFWAEVARLARFALPAMNQLDPLDASAAAFASRITTHLEEQPGQNRSR